MRRVVIGLLSTISGMVFLFSYHTSTNSGGTSLAGAKLGAGTSGTAGGTSGGDLTASPSPEPLPAQDPAQPATDDAGASAAASPAADAPSPTPTPAKATKPSGTIAGDVAQTQWGPVQVKITVKNGRIVASDVLQVPMENHHDVVINTEAVPMLNQMTVDAQSAQFDNISGATVTTNGYKESLQSAIDKAHL